MDFVEKVKLFNQIAGTKEEFDKRKLCLYIGLVLEETRELIEGFRNERNEEMLIEFENTMKFYSEHFKKGTYDALAEHANRVKISDGAGDTAVVSIGTLLANGADVQGTLHNIADSNLTKFPLVAGLYTVIKDENGKVKKPSTFKEPELEQFLFPIIKP